MEVVDPDLEGLFAGSAETAYRQARLVITAIDATWRVACSACLFDQVGSRASFRPGTPIEALFAREPLRSAALAAFREAAAGDTRTFEFETPRGERPGRVRAHFIPRFHAPESRRGVFVLAYDMAERDHASAAAEAMKDRLAAILDHAADALVIVGESGVIEEANVAATRLFGWSAEELVGQPVSILMDAPHASMHQGHVETYLRTGRSAILNVGPRALPARRKDGAALAIELAVGEARIAGARKFIGAARDISERLRQDEALRRVNRALEDKVAELERLGAELQEQTRRSEDLAQAAELARQSAERANLAKSRLLATVSHELRTPLNGVLAVADLLAARELPTDARQLAEIIRRSGRELVDLVDDVLDLSRIEAGALDIAAEPFAPAALMGALAEVWRIAAQAKGLTLEARFDDLPPWMIGDRVRLGQILANVISNAIKYTARGGVTLTARSAPQPSGLQRLTLQVADTGPGIDAGLAARLFKPFARGVAEHSRRETGTGLGLAISRELISLMGGEIVARNGEAGGTEVVVTLDLPLTDPPASLGCAEEAPPAGLERPLRVLVAEDHEVNRRIIGLLLDQLGCSYAMACDGEEAVAAARASAFDVVLMDVRMPRMDGLEATRAIRAGQGPCAATPIIAVTADAMAASDPEIVDAGVSGVLTKPVTLPALAAALGAASDARGQHESPAFSDGATRSSCGGTT